MIKFDAPVRCFDIAEALAEDERVPFRLFHTPKVLREDPAVHLLRKTLSAMPPGVLDLYHSHDLYLSDSSG